MSEIQSYLTPRPAPIRSISLKPIDQKMPTHRFGCPCQMCSIFEYKKGQQQLHKQALISAQKIKERINSSRGNIRAKRINGYYQWVLRHLLVPSGKICQRGIDITIPQTLYYKDGEAIELFLNKQIQEPMVKKIPKQKLTNTLIQKVLGERRKKYRDYIKIKLGVKKVEAKKKNLFGRKQVIKQIKDAVLIRQNDGYQYLATENQLLGLILKRKQDPIWRRILCIKNFINVPSYNSNSLAIKYSRSNQKYQHLFERSQILMKVYGKNIMEGQDKYISEADEAKFQKQLKASNRQVYAEYITYKIVNFIQYFYDQQIQKITAIYLFNQIGQIILNQVCRLEVQGLIKFEWTDQVYKKMVEEEERKFFHAKQIEVTETLQQNSSQIEKEMMHEYEKMRDYYGLTAQDQDDTEEIANNTFFKKMHPNFKHQISDVLKNPNLTLEKFKKNYLGLKKERSPIVKTFNSSMIKTIHDLSPRWKRAAPHLFIPSPKTTTAFSFMDNPEQFSPALKGKNRRFPTTSRRIYSTLVVQLK